MKESRQIAEWVVNTKPADIPAEVKSEASKALLNILGAALGASRHPSIEYLLRALAVTGINEDVQVIGRQERTDLLSGCLVNGTMGHVLDYDDTVLETVLHPSSPVFPVVLALGEREQISGEKTLAAFVLGCEVAGRVAAALCPSHYDAGWHVTGTAGTFGASAAAGYLLGLTGKEMTWALALAASQAGGIREMLGSMAKPFHAGRAAQNGLLAALLAREGFTGSEEPIEGRRGYGRAAASKPDFKALTSELGSDWVLSRNTYKAFSCGVVSHPILDGMIRLKKMGLSPHEVDRIEIRVNRLVPELMGNRNPKTGLEGKFSAYHCAAVGLIDGAGGPAQFSDARVQDKEVAGLREKVSLLVREGIRKHEVKIKVTKKDGTTLSVHVEHALGSLGNPMRESDLETKFRSLAQGVLSQKRQDQVIRLCWEWKDLPDLSLLLKRLSSDLPEGVASS